MQHDSGFLSRTHSAWLCVCVCVCGEIGSTTERREGKEEVASSCICVCRVSRAGLKFSFFFLPKEFWTNGVLAAQLEGRLSFSRSLLSRFCPSVRPSIHPFSTTLPSFSLFPSTRLFHRAGLYCQHWFHCKSSAGSNQVRASQRYFVLFPLR